MHVKQWLTGTSMIALVVIAAMVLTCSLGSTSAAPEKAAIRVKWEYTVSTGDVNAMNKLGADGWELVQVTGGESHVASTSAPIPNVGTRNTIAYAPIRSYFRRAK